MGIPFDGARYTGQEFVQADVRVHWSYPTGDGYAFINKERSLILLPFDAAGALPRALRPRGAGRRPAGVRPPWRKCRPSPAR